jgi:16S rRNA (guanine1516-N2)-methyltransferase
VIPLGVTVSARHGLRHLEAARAKAAEWGLPWLERPEPGGVTALLERTAEALLIFGGKGWVLRDRQGELGFSPGLATVRLKRLEAGAGEADALLRFAELGPGDVVFDATLGLAADALVCARAVGPGGRVVGVEASRPLALLVEEGLRRLPALPDRCRVEARHGRAEAALAALAPGSVDCVMLDPMFARPRRASPAFEALRRFAVHEPVTAELLALARRAVRRWVLVKAGRHGGELRRLGLSQLPQSRYGPVVWARLGPVS